MSTATATPEAPGTTKSMGQTYYDDVEELKASGMSNADAIRQVAEKYGKPVGSVRGGIHQYKTRTSSGSPSVRGRSRTVKSVDDFVERARSAVADALLLIDHEVEQARAQYEAAKQHYEDVQASVDERRADLKKKYNALT